MIYSRQREVCTLQDETKHVWLDLCAEAAICEDAARLRQIEAQIVDLLRKEQQRLNVRMQSDSTLRGTRTVA